jgi:hypothetical protein
MGVWTGLIWLRIKDQWRRPLVNTNRILNLVIQWDEAVLHFHQQTE